MNRLILLAESRIRGDVYVRFGGEHLKTHRRNTTGRRVFSLHIAEMETNPGFSIDASNTAYIIFMIIGIVGYFTIPTVANWIISAGGVGNYNRNVSKAGAYAAGAAGAAAGNIAGRLKP